MTTPTPKPNDEVLARGRSLPISTKYSIEICREIRNKPLARAKRILEDVVTMRRALPIKRFTFDLGHKSGMAAASYPVAASRGVLKIIALLEANAENKGLNPEKLTITFAKADKAERRWHTGRQRPTLMKSTHIELRAREHEEKK